MSCIKNKFHLQLIWVNNDEINDYFISKSQENQNLICKRFIMCYGYVEETIETLTVIGKLKGEYFKNLESIKLNGLEFHLKPRFGIGDHSYLRKINGNSVTHPDSCELCKMKIEFWTFSIRRNVRW